jgi:hypothetical protein
VFLPTYHQASIKLCILWIVLLKVESVTDKLRKNVLWNGGALPLVLGKVPSEPISPLGQATKLGDAPN